MTTRTRVGIFHVLVFAALLAPVGSARPEEIPTPPDEIPTSSEKDSAPQLRDRKVLLLVAGSYGGNTNLTVDLFERNGFDVVRVGLTETIEPCPYYARPKGCRPVKADLLLDEVKSLAGYDGLALAPSPGHVADPYGDILASPKAMALIASARKEGVVLFSTCAGIRVLAAADAIRGCDVVGSPRFRKECEAAGARFVGKDHPPVRGRNVVTCARDRYYSMSNCEAFALAMEERRSRERARGGTIRALPAELTRAEASFAEEKGIRGITIGGRNADGARAICGERDSGFLVVGYTFSSGAGDADVLAVRLDVAGNIIWSKSYGGPGTEYGNACLAVEGGFLLTGTTTSCGAGSRDVLLLRIDEAGNLLWSRTFGGPGADAGTALCAAGTDSPGFLVAGSTASAGAGEEDVFVVRTDNQGRELWSRAYGGARYERGNAIHARGDGTFLVSATTGTFGKGNSDAWTITIDVAGKEIGTRSFGNAGPGASGFDWCSALRPAGEGGHLLVGYSDFTDMLNAWIVRVDACGKTVWSKTFGNTTFYDYGNDVAQAEDGGFLLAGTAKSFDGNNDVYMARLDRDGDVTWSETIGGARSEWGSCVVPAGDGGFLVAGQTASAGAGSFDVLLLEVDPERPASRPGR